MTASVKEEGSSRMSLIRLEQETVDEKQNLKWSRREKLEKFQGRWQIKKEATI
jgi:hypothetical protein